MRACFVPLSSLYDDDSTAHSFTLFLNLSETPEVKIKKNRNDRGGLMETEYVKGWRGGGKHSRWSRRCVPETLRRT